MKEGAKTAGRPRDRRTNEAILDAALALLVEAGVEGASLEKIARRAGTTRAAVYRRYKNKAELLAHAVGQLRERAEAALGRWETMSLAEIAQVYQRPETIRLMLGNTRLLSRLIGSVSDHPEIMAAYSESYLEPRRETFKRILERAKADGTLGQAADPEIITDMISGAVITRLLIRKPPAGEEEMRDYLDRMFRQLYNGRRPMPP